MVFLAFALAFFVSAPLVVLYTAGYRLDLTHGRIVHTAVLNIKSEPRGARVFIDTVEQRERTAAVIENVLPGERVLGLQKTGYLSWESRLSFESRQARVIGPIVLFLDTPPALERSLTPMLARAHEASDQFAYVTQESSWLEVWRVQAGTGAAALLMRLPYDERARYALDWSAAGTYLALVETRDAMERLLVVRTSDGTAAQLPDSAKEAQEHWWDAGSDETLYIRTGSVDVSRVNVARGLEEPLAFEAHGVTSHAGQTLALSLTSRQAVLSRFDGEAVTILTYLPLGEYAFVQAPEGLAALIDTRRHRLILIDLSNREQPIVLNEEARLWKWHPSGDVLLYSSGYDLKRYVRSVHETQTLTRLSTTIDAIDWHPLGTAALYQSDGRTLALHLDGSSVLSEAVLATDLVAPFWIDSDGKRLSFLRQTDTGIDWWTRALR